MRPRNWGALALLVAIVGWWYSPASPRVPAFAVAAHGSQPQCPMPPRVAAGDPPLQSAVPSNVASFQLAAAQLQPLAGFSVDARVLSRRDYSLGREAQLSPTDLALGWGRMRDDAVLSQLQISQSSRWYRYGWSGDPPLPPEEIARSSANMHLIPSDAESAAELHRVRDGSHIRIDGWLVEATSPDGYHWRSSTTREDTGAGACEVVYVCAITQL
ncbi:hypothetical protein [Cognatiluteimonas profundi]|uniref:hypothetical protein n=1 Tax=Cognatiluteimonas profundi TaxID=2594501 RepID=UPI00131C717E|nr:hypothetical protein [Lysobacter profundi]